MKANLTKDNFHLKMDPEMEALINDPVYPTEEDLKDPRIRYLLEDDFFKDLPSCPDAYGGDTERYLEMMDEPVEDSNNEGEIKASTKEQINKDAWVAFLEMRAATAEAGLQDMTLDKINAEIQETRNGR